MISPKFLAPDATTETLIRAAAANHKAWFRATTLAAGGAMRRTEGAAWMRAPDEGIIPFPRLSSARAGNFIDAVAAECRTQNVTRIGFWATTPIAPRDLGARLTARGFEWGWRPHWMALDFRKIGAASPVPGGLRIALAEDADWDATDLPYYSRGDLPKMRALRAALPRRTWHFGAWLDGKIVGQAVVYLTTGSLGAAGIYNVGVVPAARRQGVGRAVTRAACRFAQSMGCHYALLNSATSIYEQIGFESLGHGQTWWLHEKALKSPAPTPEQIAFVEAIGRGDIVALDSWNAARRADFDFDALLLCGSRPMTLAVRANCPRSLEWLIAQGATLDILSLWDIGQSAQAAALLTERPELANRQSGPGRLTPLHEAAFRNDIELTRLLLTADPDLTLRDAEYNGTPLNWAEVFDRAEIAALLTSHTGDGSLSPSRCD